MATLLNRSSFDLLSTSGGSSGLFKYTFYTTITEEVDELTNTSMLNAKLTYKADTSGLLFNNGGFTATLQYSLDDANWVKIAEVTKTSYTGTSEVTLVSGTSFAIRHNEDGKKTIYYRVVITNKSSYAPRSGNHKWTLTLTDIPRGHQFTLDKTMLTSGETVTLSIVKSIDTYTSSVTWQRGESSGTLLNKSNVTSLSIPYETIADGMATGVSATVVLTCVTYNGNTEVSSTALNITVSSGYIALSLYDDGVGDVGATIGERATGGGFNVLTNTAFGKENKKVDVNYSNSFSKGRFEKLWSQSATSLGQTTINVDLSNFEAIVIVTTTGTYYNFALTTRIDGVWQGDTHKTKVTEQQAGRMVARYFSVFEDHIVVGAGYRFNTYGSSTSTTDNAQVVPVAIIGIH